MKESRVSGFVLTNPALKRMTERDAAEYARLSALQEAMAQEVLSLLALHSEPSLLAVTPSLTLVFGMGVPLRWK